MAKKSTAIVAKPEPASEPESTASDVTAEAAMERPDPTLLGVRVPLAVTFAAFKQVAEAWRECLRELSEVVKTKGKTAIAPAEALTDTPVVEA